MEILSAKWLSELDLMEEFTYDQHPMSPTGCYSIDNQELYFNETQSFSTCALPIIESPQANNNNVNIVHDRPRKQHKTTSWNSCPTPSSSSHIISFDNPNSSPLLTSHQLHSLDLATVKRKNEMVFEGNGSYELTSGGGGGSDNKRSNRTFGSTSRSPSLAQDHVIAERKRRENISQRFISLSAVIPGLKKMDKASVLGDAVKYLKQLQERVKFLEEKVSRKTMESVVFVKKTQVYADQDESSSTDEYFDGVDYNHSNGYIQDHPLPEIEVRVLEKDLLLRIHCEKQKNCVLNVISEIEKRHLNVINSSVLQFGNSTLDITITAQMEANFSMTMKDLIRNIRQSLLKSM